MSAARLRIAPAATLAVLALGLGPAAPAAAQVLGEVVAVHNSAEFSRGDGPPRGLRPKMPLALDMRIVTFVDADALMSYDHPRAMLFLGPETELVMRSASAALADYPCPNSELVDRLADLAQEKGAVRVVRERAPEGCPLRVLTQVAVIVIDGTDLTVRVDPADGTTVVSVAEGAVDVYRRNPETGEPTGEPVRLEAGDVSVVAPGRRPSLPAPADPGVSLQSPAVQAEPLPDPLGAPVPPRDMDLDDLCTTDVDIDDVPPFCRIFRDLGDFFPAAPPAPGRRD
jgi:hypothetical protein